MKFKNDRQRKAVMSKLNQGGSPRGSSCVPSPTTTQKYTIYNVDTNLKEDKQIDSYVRKFSKKELLDEAEELGLKNEYKKALSQMSVKHPSSGKLEDYSHRAIARAGFVVNKINWRSRR